MLPKCLLMLGLLVLAVSEVVAQQVLRVGFFELRPHVVAAGAGLAESSGPALEYWRDIAARMDVQLTVNKESLPLDRLLYQLSSGELDVVLALGRNPEREALCSFPARPFFSMQPALMLPKSSPVRSIDGLRDLKELRIGVYSSGYMSPLMRHPGLRLETMHGESVVLRNYRKLQAGRIDAVYSPDSLDLRTVAEINGFLEQVRILALPEAPVGLYSCFSKKIDPALIAKYEQALGQMSPYRAYIERAARRQ